MWHKPDSNIHVINGVSIFSFSTFQFLLACHLDSDHFNCHVPCVHRHQHADGFLTPVLCLTKNSKNHSDLVRREESRLLLRHENNTFRLRERVWKDPNKDVKHLVAEN